MDEMMRETVLRDAPPGILNALRRIHYWANGDLVNIRDKIAVDDLFTFVAKLMSENATLSAEVAEFRHLVGTDEEDERC